MHGAFLYAALMAKDLRTYLSNSRTRLPEPLSAAELIAHIRRRTADRQGATISPYFGDMLGQPLYAVSLFPEQQTALVIAGRELPADVLEAFLRTNRELLADPRLCIGSWYQAESDLMFIDIVAVLPDREVAAALGRQYNQIAIFDLAAEKEIDTGGTGAWVSQDTPPNRRLPALKRG